MSVGGRFRDSERLGSFIERPPAAMDEPDGGALPNWKPSKSVDKVGFYLRGADVLRGGKTDSTPVSRPRESHSVEIADWILHVL